MITVLRAAAVAVLLAAPVLSVSAAPATVDLAAFRGNYTGTMTLTTGSTYPGTVKIRIAVPKNGRSATVVVVAAVPDSGTIVTLRDAYYFRPRRVFTEEDVLFGLATPTPATGTYRARKGKITFTAPFSGGTSSGVLSVRQTGRKRVLTLTTNLTFTGGGSGHTVTATASAR